MTTAESRAWRPRWWEDYLVRYFTGTLVGTFCVFILITEMFFRGEIGTLAKLMFFSPDKDSTWLGLIVLILAGGAFCYLASVPITVFHSGRMIREGMNRFARRAWYIWWGVCTVVLVGATLDFALLRYFPAHDLLAYSVLVVSTGPAVWLFIGQIDVIWRLKKAQDSPTSAFISFYRQLVRARDKAAFSGVRESYTHMREHANSVFIVVIELSMLSSLLILWRSINDLALFAIWCLAFLLLWTSPNVLLWGLANSLERDLSEDVSLYVETKGNAPESRVAK